MERNKMVYWMKFRPAERLRERENDALRRQAAAFRKCRHDAQRRFSIKIVAGLTSFVSLIGAALNR